MENLEKVDPVVGCELLGEFRCLKYTLRAMKRFQQLTGVDFNSAIIGNPTQLGALILAGLIGADPARYDGQVIDGVPEKRLSDLIEQIDDSIEFIDIPKWNEIIKGAVTKARPIVSENSGEKKE